MIKPVLKLQCQAMIVGVACLSALPASPVLAGVGYGSSPSGIVEMEIVKRQQRIADAQAAEAEGDRLTAEQDYEGAIGKYREALDLLPLGSMAAADRDRVTKKYAKVAVIHAEELGHRGAFDKARALLNSVLDENVEPNNAAARKLLKDLDDPDRFNQAMSEKHYENIEEVKRLFRLGMGYYDLGQYKEAEQQFNRILAIDPHNVAARRQMERVSREISNYLRAARDDTRLRMLNDVDKLWETAVPGATPGAGQGTTTVIEAEPGAQAITAKVQSIVLERIQFAEASIDEAVQLLRRKSIEADSSEPDPSRKGVDIIINSSEGAKPITLDLRNVSLIDAIKRVTEQAGLRYRLEPSAVIITSLTATDVQTMQTRIFRAPPDFLTRGGAVAGAASGGGGSDPFGGGDDSGGSQLGPRPDAKAVLEGFGIVFPENASASFSAASSRLVVRNTLEQLDAIEVLLDEMFRGGTKQVFITTKFLEVSQRNTDELGFDTLVGAFNIGSGGVFGSGGTTGNASGLNAQDYPLTSQNLPIGNNPISRGLRFGSDAINRNAIDALIAGGTASGASTVTPAAFALAGVFTDPQFQIVMRALSQKKGVDLMTAPSVIARSGQKSKVEVIREFPYPTEFDPPQIPQTFGNTGVNFSQDGSGAGSFPVTPTTPQSFEYKNTGVTMEVQPTVADDGYTIDLELAPEVVEFEGFINYGSPIQTTGINALGQSETLVLTDNRILQPVFATRRLTTQVLIWDRQTVGMGGLIREDVQSVEDKVPLFGDIPFIGRLFKTKAEEHFKRNLMIYVTGTLLDPSGQPLNSGDGGEAPPTQVIAPPPGPDASLLPAPMK